jgi:hypothetical protein
MVGVLAVGFVANLLIRPVDRRHMEPSEVSGRFHRERVTEREPATAERS